VRAARNCGALRCAQSRSRAVQETRPSALRCGGIVPDATATVCVAAVRSAHEAATAELVRRCVCAEPGRELWLVLKRCVHCTSVIELPLEWCAEGSVWRGAGDHVSRRIHCSRFRASCATAADLAHAPFRRVPCDQKN
jgi:hypothetical protein